jgi:hypothetical protein
MFSLSLKLVHHYLLASVDKWVVDDFYYSHKSLKKVDQQSIPNFLNSTCVSPPSSPLTPPQSLSQSLADSDSGKHLAQKGILDSARAYDEFTYTL